MFSALFHVFRGVEKKLGHLYKAAAVGVEIIEVFGALTAEIYNARLF